MSEKNKKNKTSKRKPNTFRIATFGIGAVIVIVLAITIITILVKEANQEPENAINPESHDVLESHDISESTDISEESIEIFEEESVSDSEPVEENTTEEPDNSMEDSDSSIEEPDSSIEEPESSEESDTELQIDLSDPAAIIANWENIPAGTVISATSIDFNNLNQYFVAYEISDEVFHYINGKSYQENPHVGLDDLRYLKLLHYNFNHELQVGELIVAADLQTDFIGIFMELFQAEYEIQSMYLPDRYWTGDPTTTDSASIDVNNTSCFMYRPATGSGNLSKHAYGHAIDINPQQNPYVSYTSGSPVWSHENANDYIDRTTGLPHVITEEDICYQIFIKYGFTWGGAWTNIKDYQHFQK